MFVTRKEKRYRCALPGDRECRDTTTGIRVPDLWSVNPLLVTLQTSESTMPHHFSTAARALIKFLWDGMDKDTARETAGRQCIENSIKLPAIEIAKVK